MTFAAFRFVGCALALSTLSVGCRSPQTILPEVSEEAVRQERREQRTRFLDTDEGRRIRLHRVGFPILAEAASLFDHPPHPALGILLSSRTSFAPPYRDLAVEHWELREGPVIRHVVAQSPADLAGLGVGDRITRLDGESMSEDPDVYLRQLRAALEAAGSVRLTVRDPAGQTRETDVVPVPLLDYRVVLRYDGRINARATGRMIEINRGMLDFCLNDTELAYIVAHELAHNALRHHRDYVINYLVGTVADVALLSVGVPTPNAVGLLNAVWPSPGYEMEADYVALFLLVRAGFDPREMLDIWPRLASLSPEQIPKGLLIRTHPDFASRQVRLKAAIDEIERLAAAGAPLVPARR